VPPFDHLTALAALAEPLRRRLYRYVASGRTAASRDAAAAALGVPRSVAAFHLDKLAEAGLLEVEYRRPPGRSGPGAGRPAKLYRRAAHDVVLSVPERRYEVVASLLAAALEQADERPAPVALCDLARDHGRHLGSSPAGARSAKRRRLERVSELLSAEGYEPRLERDTLVLDNCPFARIAEEHRDLVCGMNHALVEGVLEAVGLPPDDARLEPDPGRCCVKVTTT
jgi:predicted ArsR family transcriptional regulator